MASYTTRERGLGQTAYEAYAVYVGWKNHQGGEMPPWARLPCQIQEAWIEAVRAAVMKRGFGT